MKKIAALLLLATTAIATGAAAAHIVLAFEPDCGYDCENHAFGVFVVATGGCLLAFLGVGFASGRRSSFHLRSAAIASVALAAGTLLLAGGYYAWQLHARYIEAQAANPVRPDLDFMYMAIATRDIQTYTQAGSGPSRAAAVVPRWQRCVIDGAWCDRHPRQAHLRCQHGVVYVNEPDWKAFTLIPEENLAGAIPMKSMNLCTTDNLSDP